MKNLNTIHIDIEDNEEVSDLFQGCKAGDVVRITAEVTITEHTEDRVSGAIDGVESLKKISGYDDDDDDDDDEEEEEVESADETY
jgi:hypothetical protein